MTDRNQTAQGEGEGSARSNERSRAADEVTTRLRRRGVQVFGDETGDELSDLLDAVEQFEDVVEDSGGDLMIDEPIGDISPIAPDNAAFVLPNRNRNESVADFMGRIADAARRAGMTRDDDAGSS